MAVVKYSIFLILLAGGQLATIAASGSNQNSHERNKRKLHNYGNNQAPHPPPTRPPPFPTHPPLPRPAPVTVHMPVQHPTFYEHGGAGVYSQSNSGYGYHAPVPSIRDYISEGSGVYGKAESTPGYHDQHYNVPNPRPTDRPTPYPMHKSYPTDESYPIHNPYPTDKPYSNRKRTHRPTYSLEPSQFPSESLEPSEEPTMSEEPSENPTESLEPSELPSLSEEPNSRLSIFEFICDDANVDTFRTFCAVITTSPAIRGILDNSAFVDTSSLQGIPGFDSSVLSKIDNRFRRRNLERSPLTLFAPNNDAMERLLQRSINEFFDADEAETIAYFEGIHIDISDDNEVLDNFLFTPNGRIILDEIILTHIVNEELSFEMLTCENMITMISGDITVTDCITVQAGRARSKFQIGSENDASHRPNIIREDILVSNGVVHEVNEVILPKLDVPENTPITGGPGFEVTTPFLTGGILNGLIIRTQDPTETPDG